MQSWTLLFSLKIICSTRSGCILAWFIEASSDNSFYGSWLKDL
ncbi:hypothetical protein AMTRI_Chr12g239900 [Amborella trichopoda]